MPNVSVRLSHIALFSIISEIQDGKLISGSWNHTIKIWNTTTGKCLKTLIDDNDNDDNDNDRQRSANPVIVCGDMVVSATKGKLKTWNPITGKDIHTFDTKGLFGTKDPIVDMVSLNKDTVAFSAGPDIKVLRLNLLGNIKNVKEALVTAALCQHFENRGALPDLKNKKYSHLLETYENLPTEVKTAFSKLVCQK